MYIGGTKFIDFTFDSDIIADLNDAVNLVIYILVNKKTYLKFKLGGGIGYDGDIVIGTPTNKCTIYITRPKSLTLKPGNMDAEALLMTADVNYNPDGKALIVFPAIDKVYKSYTTAE